MTRFNRSTTATLGAALTLCTALTSPLWAEAGYRTTTLDVAHRDRDVELHIWYPADPSAGIKPGMLGENAVFKGASVLHSAPAVPGTYPLVVLSHGSGGNAANLSWIAGALAETGMIVAAPNHPGTTSRDSLQSETIKTWERPADLSAIVDLALGTGLGLTGVQIDAGSVAAMGFSLGGYSALAVGGAQVSKADYITYCDQNAGMMDCGWLAAGGVDFTQIDQARYEQSNHDPRIKAVVSIDPALSAAFTTVSLGKMDLPVQLINLGQGADVPAAIDAANLVDRMPRAELHQLADATHFSFLGLCKRMGATFLRAVGEDPICTEAGDRNRADIHHALTQQITGFLTRVFAKSG